LDRKKITKRKKMDSEKIENLSNKCDFIRMKRDHFRTEIRKEDLKRVIEKKRFNLQESALTNSLLSPEILENLKFFSKEQVKIKMNNYFFDE
jgi:hypothetical protein